MADQTMQRLSSAKLVVPARTLSIPFWRSRCVPSATAASSITDADACSRMRARMRGGDHHDFVDGAAAAVAVVVTLHATRRARTR